jgi:6-phosphofructokinase 1
LKGGEVIMSGREDAFGHRKLGGIGAITGDLIKEITGENIIYQQVAYLMRSGSPDSLDLMVAMNYATMAADLAVNGSSGRMVALRNGIYTHVALKVTSEGTKNVDVPALYDKENYRPKIRQVEGIPMFLY